MDNGIVYQIGWQDYKLSDEHQYKKPSYARIAEDCALEYVEKIKWVMCPNPLKLAIFHNGEYAGSFDIASILERRFIASKAR